MIKVDITFECAYCPSELSTKLLLKDLLDSESLEAPEGWAYRVVSMFRKNKLCRNASWKTEDLVCADCVRLQISTSLDELEVTDY